MYCRNCGNEILETDRFCWKCGSKVLNAPDNIKIKESTFVSDKEEEIKLDKLIDKLESKTSNNGSKNNHPNSEIITELPMNWWNFWKYVRFPLGFIFSLINFNAYSELTFDFYISSFFIIDILIVAFMAFTYYLFINKKKSGYKVFNTFLFVEAIYSCAFATLKTASQNNQTLKFGDFMLNYVLVLIIWGLIWVLPNYIYFKKRKNCFCND